MGLIGGPLGIYQANYANQRGRVSLQWTKTTGKTGHCEQIFRGGSHHSTWRLNATYTYIVNNQQYTGHQVTLWDPEHDIPNFLEVHPFSSPIDVYYDPQNPGDSVLIPGADEATNRIRIQTGTIATGLAILVAFMVPSKFAAYKQEKGLKNIKI